MSSDTANHRPTDQDPEPEDDASASVIQWDGLPEPGSSASTTSPF